MRFLVVCACAMATLQSLHAQAPNPPRRALALAAPTRLPVRRVVLYKNGIGYFEHVGRVRGSGSVAIEFNTTQLNDVLKSLTVLDLGNGRIGNVSFNSEAPLAQQLETLGFPLGAPTSRLELLGVLHGARVEVHAGDRTIVGRLLGVERRTRANGDLPRDEMTVVTDAGDIRSMDLTPSVSVRLTERDSADQVSTYLGLLASSRSQERRRMTIATSGVGARDVLVGYISETPVWKTTYRIVLPSGGAQPILQGWAVVDNTIGDDWNGVELSLVAGAPQSFIQPLSQPQYVQRPTIGIPRVNMPGPQTHQETLATVPNALTGRVVDAQGAVLPGVTVTAIDRSGRRFTAVTDAAGRYLRSGLSAGTYRIEFTLAGFQPASFDRIDFTAAGLVAPDAILRLSAAEERVTVTGQSPRLNNVGKGGGSAGGVFGGVERGLDAAPAAGPVGVDRMEIAARLADMQAAAQGQNLGDLFEYRIATPVTIRRNQSALVPILKADVDVERVSLWNERIGGARPLRGLWLTNSSSLTLDTGSFTVLDDATFAGEGLIEPLKPGEKRLLSYAVDLGVQVDSRHGDDHQVINRVRIERGTAVQESEQRARKVYTIRNSDAVARTIVIEHPIRAGWMLVKGVEPVETSLGAYRFAVPVAPKTVATLTVEERQPTESRYAIAQLSDQQIAVFVRQTRENTTLTQALGPIQTKKLEVATLVDQLGVREAEATSITEAQTRLRENMRALKGSADEQLLLKRYVKQLNQQEDRIEALNLQKGDLQDKLGRAQAELAQLIGALTLDIEVAGADGANPGADVVRK